MIKLETDKYLAMRTTMYTKNPKRSQEVYSRKRTSLLMDEVVITTYLFMVAILAPNTGHLSGSARDDEGPPLNYFDSGRPSS